MFYFSSLHMSFATYTRAACFSFQSQQLSGNKIENIRALEPQLRQISTLETIYLEGNPCQAKEGANYRRKVILALPQITQLDATYVLNALSPFKTSC